MYHSRVVMHQIAMNIGFMPFLLLFLVYIKMLQGYTRNYGK